MLLRFTRLIGLLGCLAFAMTGCIAGGFTGSSSSVTSSSNTTTPASTSSNLPSSAITTSSVSSAYHAYGDSITYGYTLSDPAMQAYPVLAGQAAGLTVTDRGNPGDLACDVSGFAILPNDDSPSATSSLRYSLMVGTNDLDYEGTGVHELDYTRCLQGSLAWLAVPSEFKMLVSNTSVTEIGKGQTELRNGVTTRSFSVAGDTLSFHFNISFAAPIYVWYRMAYGNAGAFSWSIDGTAGGTPVSREYTPQISEHGFSSAMALLRIPSVPAGDHVLTLTETISAPAGMSIVGIGVAPPAGQVGLSRVLAGTIPRQLQGGGSACDLNDAICTQYTADVKAAVALFAGDGLNVHLFDSRAYTTGTTADMNDRLHPNQLGHQEIAHAVEDVLN